MGQSGGIQGLSTTCTTIVVGRGRIIAGARPPSPLTTSLGSTSSKAQCMSDSEGVNKNVFKASSPFVQKCLDLQKKSIYRTMCNNLQIKNRSSHIQHQQTLDHRLYRASQYVEEAEAEIDILEDLEQLNVKTTNDAYDDDDDSAFIIIESKSGAKDNVIESFFNDPKKFTKSPPRLQSSAVDSSSSSFKKFNKLSQKERKKQQKQQHSKLYYIYIFKTKIKKKNSFGVLNQLLHGFFVHHTYIFSHLLIVKF